ncbi:MAG: hypothetical protein AAF587_00655 [Bacteroidota bacterium]
MTTNTAILRLWLAIVACLFSFFSTNAQEGKEIPWNDYQVIRDNIDVHAQKALLRMVHSGDSEKMVMAADLLNWAEGKNGTIEGIFIVDQKVPALRARDNGSAWWLLVPKDSIILMDKPASRDPLLAMPKKLVPNPSKVDQAMIHGWAKLMAKGGFTSIGGKSPKNPFSDMARRMREFFKKMGIPVETQELALKNLSSQ